MNKQISIARKPGGRYILIPPKNIKEDIFKQAAIDINEWVREENPVLVLTGDWQCISVIIDKRKRESFLIL